MKNRILRSALSVALCAAMLLSQGLTAFAENEIVPSPNNEGNSAAAEFSLLEEKAGEPSVTDGDKGCHPDPIPKPSEEDIAAQLEYKLTCTNEDFSDEHSMPESNLLAQYISNIDWNRNETNATATIDVDQILDTYKFNDTHKLVFLNPMKVSLEYENNQWGLAASQDNVLDIKVICTKVPATPIEPGEINEEVLKAIIDVKMKCTNQYHEDSNFDVPDENLMFEVGEITGEKGTYSFNVTLDPNDYLALYNEEHEEHSLVDKDKKEIVINFTLADGKVTPSQKQVIIEVTCNATKPIPLPSESNVIAALPGFSFDCENSNCNASESIDLKDLAFTIGEVNSAADTVNITFDNAAFSTSLAKFNEKYGKHNLAKEEPIVVTLTWNAEKDFWYYAGNVQNIIVPVECSFPSNNVPAVPTYKDLEELLGNMTVYCVNENHLVSKAYPITWNTIGGLNQKPVQNDDGTFSMEITVSYDPFKDLFEDDFGAHDYVESIELAHSVVSLKWSEIEGVGAWRVDGSFINSFNVICDTPSTESLWGWNNGKEVIITCVEENALHTKGMTLSLVGVNGDKYWKFDPITWDQEQKCYTTTVTLEPDKYLEVYSGQYGEHALVSDHEDTVLSLKLSYQDGNQDGNGKWISNGDKFYLFVECNAPSKPTIEDLDKLFTNNTKVNISCEKNKHADEGYPVKDNSVDRLGYLFIGPVEVDDNNHYTAKISLNDAFFINLYNQEEGGHHSLVSKTYITLSYDGEKWVFNDESKLDFDVVVTCPDNDNPGGGEDPGTNPGGGDNGNNGGNNNGGSTGGGSSVSRRDDDDDWEPLPNNNYRVTKKNDKPSQNTQIVVRDPADNSDNTSSNTGSDSGKHNPETGDTTTAFAAMALAAVSLGGVVLLGRKKK